LVIPGRDELFLFPEDWPTQLAPGTVTEIKGIFDTWQLAQYLDVARQTEPFDPGHYDETDDPEEVEMERKDDIRRCTNDLLLVEWARELLLDVASE
jgi:hypothetical protein